MQVECSHARLICLSKGLWSLVDVADYERLNAFKWYACRNRAGGVFYAARDSRAPACGATILMHRELLGLPVGRTPQVDHVNMDTLDNRRSNLRIATHENQWNKRAYANNTSGFKGVSWDSTREKWTAQIKAQGTFHHLGRYDNILDAAHAYDAAAIRLHGEFARINFPNH